tara:strand:+ start:1368 stop:1565 length:198 start_codon:yes stop_codon:yes gene_type:complete
MLLLWGVNMCLVCIEYQKGNLTVFEAKRNLTEMYIDVGLEHTLEALKIIEEVEDIEKVKEGKELE